jgi:hypothetical protein
MRVDREGFRTLDIIMCPLPGCHHRWCKSCRKEVGPCDTGHRCRNWRLDGLAWTKGWRSCPGIQFYLKTLELGLTKIVGCGVIVERISGCNHMVVSDTYLFCSIETQIECTPPLLFSASPQAALCKRADLCSHG